MRFFGAYDVTVEKEGKVKLPAAFAEKVEAGTVYYASVFEPHEEGLGIFYRFAEKPSEDEKLIGEYVLTDEKILQIPDGYEGTITEKMVLCGMGDKLELGDGISDVDMDDVIKVITDLGF